ncbi:flagellar basal-body MS-ring/collar protein FliF [Rubrivirga sp.]|uniref:flagellar basal-body MS-ring/collar protein FliF n=1 Tax=Rubrivirga sp. TaxID=1885344 RepID=UPI003C757373
MSSIAQARESIEQLPPQRRMVLGGVVVAVVVGLLLVARWASQPDYALLFGNLAAQDAGSVVEALESQGINYDLRDGGTAVFVPRDQVYALRVSMATAGTVTDGPAGYELFDTGTLGMTDFMQRLNVKRALEGELSRTIASVRQIERARVHLVLPERSPFRDQQIAATASVVLSVRGTLSPDQVSGVAALVAGAVEDMDPTQVTVLDEAGRMLTGPGADAGEGGLSTAQMRMRREVEEHLAGAGQTMLDQMLGPGRAVVRVAADLDLSSTVTERNAVDPESQTMISEERQDETADGVAANSMVRNYELTRELTRAEQEAGSIRTLTVSVLLDEAAPPAVDRPREEGEPTPFSDEQVRQIESLVKNAVGFDEGRGDRFAVQQIRFSEPPEPETGLLDGVDTMTLAGMGMQYGIVLLALFLGYRLLRRLTDSVNENDADLEDGTVEPGELSVGADGQLLGPDGQPRTTIEAVDADPYAEKLATDIDLVEATDVLEDVRAAVAADPEAAAAIVRGWIHES